MQVGDIVSPTAIPTWMVFDETSEESWSPTTTVDKSYKFYDGSIEIFFDVANHEYYRFNDEGDREIIDGVTTVLNVINKPYLKEWAVKLAIEAIRQRMMEPDGALVHLGTEDFLALLHEAKNKHKEKLNEAGDIGTLAHNSLEVAIQFAIDNTNGVVLACPTVPANDGIPEENTRKAQNCVNAAFKWMQDHNVRWLHTERKIYSLKYNYCGTLDGDALIDSCNDKFCKGCRGRQFKDRRAITDWKSSNQLSDSYAYQTASYQFAHIEEFGNLYIPDRWIMRLGKEDGDFEAWYLPDVYFEPDFNAFLAALNLYRSLDEIEERRRIEKREWTELVKAEKKAAKAAEDAAEKKRKAKEREDLVAAKKQWDADKKSFYKNLRAQKIAVAEAEKLTEAAYPPEARPGVKDIISVESVSFESSSGETVTLAPTEFKAEIRKPPAPIAAPGTWVWKP